MVADFVPSAPFESIETRPNGDRGNGSNIKSKHEHGFVISLYFLLVSFLI